MNERELIDLLKTKVAAAGTQKAFAQEAGVSLPYLNDVLRGRRAPGPGILKALGLKKVVSYERAGWNREP